MIWGVKEKGAEVVLRSGAMVGSRSENSSRSSEKERKKGQELSSGWTWELEEREESKTADLQLGVREDAGGGHKPRSRGVEAVFWGRGGV